MSGTQHTIKIFNYNDKDNIYNDIDDRNINYHSSKDNNDSCWTNFYNFFGNSDYSVVMDEFTLSKVYYWFALNLRTMTQKCRVWEYVFTGPKINLMRSD